MAVKNELIKEGKEVLVGEDANLQVITSCSVDNLSR